MKSLEREALSKAGTKALRHQREFRMYKEFREISVGKEGKESKNRKVGGRERPRSSWNPRGLVKGADCVPYLMGNESRV